MSNLTCIVTMMIVNECHLGLEVFSCGLIFMYDISNSRLTFVMSGNKLKHLSVGSLNERSLRVTNPMTRPRRLDGWVGKQCVEEVAVSH